MDGETVLSCFVKLWQSREKEKNQKIRVQPTRLGSDIPAKTRGSKHPPREMIVTLSNQHNVASHSLK